MSGGGFNLLVPIPPIPPLYPCMIMAHSEKLLDLYINKLWENVKFL